MSNVRLYYIKQAGEHELKQLDSLLIEQWVSSLSVQKQEVIQRLLHVKSRLSSLLGLRLLNRCAKEEGVVEFDLCDVQYPESGKPFWAKNTQTFDFNISHSGDFVLVVVSGTTSVGVDVEQRKALKRLNFKMVMSAKELTQIQAKPTLFFDLWSKKEAVVKAANTAGLARMADVKLKADNAMLDDKKWYLKSLNLDDDYVINIATSKPIEQLVIKQIQLSELV